MLHAKHGIWRIVRSAGSLVKALVWEGPHRLDLREVPVPESGQGGSPGADPVRRDLRREMKIVFQDPYGSLNPRKTAGSATGAERQARVERVLEVCGPARDHYRRYLHEFSGGQRQRLVVARDLLSAIPTMDPERHKDRIILKGDVPSPASPPPGCRFHTRCPYAMEVCRRRVPELKAARPGHLVACHLVHGEKE